MYKKYEDYIDNIYGEISKFYHLNYKIDNQDVIDNIKTDVVDDLL
jgi:hypothetical protein